MKKNSEQDRLNFIDQLFKYIKKHIKSKHHKLLRAFAEHYYINIATEDLLEMGVEKACDHVVSMWQLVYERAPGERKVNIYNVSGEDRTVIEISHDDMPFLVDTVRMAVNQRGLLIHLLIHTGGICIDRDKNYRITKIFAMEDLPETIAYTEAPIYVEIDKQTDEQCVLKLKHDLECMLDDTTVAVEDFQRMKHQLQETIAGLDKNTLEVVVGDVLETKEFLQWLLQDNFIFLGCKDYQIVQADKKTMLRAINASGLGVLRVPRAYELPKDYFVLPPEIEASNVLGDQLLVITKANMPSTVHRSVYADDVIVQQFDQAGKLIGVRRFLGMYTSSACNSPPQHIPFLRSKLTQVLQRSKLKLNSYAGKALKSALENLPRDDLFQASVDELCVISKEVLHMKEKQRIRLLIRKDVYNRFFSCLVYVPRDRFNTELRWKIQNILMKELQGETVFFVIKFPNNVLARIHFFVRVNGSAPDIDVASIEEQLVQAGRIWQDDFLHALMLHYGDAHGRYYFDQYKNIFPASYREVFDANTGLLDLDYILHLSDENSLNLNFYESNNKLYLKLFQLDNAIPLFEVLPVLENMGLRVIDDSPHKIMLASERTVWVNDFELVCTKNDRLGFCCPEMLKACSESNLKNIFQEAFAIVWEGFAENDGFNKLILSASLNWREITILRAYAKYLHQTGFGFSQQYIEQALEDNADITSCLIQLFIAKFDPALDVTARKLSDIEIKIESLLVDVSSLDQDRILRRYLTLIQNTLRTNYFQEGICGDKVQMRLSLKLDCQNIPDLPLPRPLYEIFVYSPRFEGVHLREGKIARGGIRWSDRREDFRTEILGLVKAQNVKNAIIVPAGAKGGFVIKQLPENADREIIRETAVYCYREFISGLLDLTDNIKNRKIIKPVDVVCYDEDDPYLVVAADKGTATFSDLANGISESYGFWLGDAFASGGSAGYDHKRMGITARGAWESVKQHFYALGVDARKEGFTVAGIGDMSGDVFGNGVLLSRHIQLVAAFDHRHIFIDPAPNPEKSFLERRRLFHLPRSSWMDYDKSQISKGGGVFDRSAKSIIVTPEIKQLLQIETDRVTPNVLMCAILKSKVDLLFNGGIGTFVKSQIETHAEAGDRSNDAIRINANELRCQVVAEGGNLGFTQQARIDFALNGGRIYTDFVDNSAGVDCSDHEVNIKILLNQIIKEHNHLTLPQRNALLVKMSNDVAKLVLKDNEHQTLAIELATISTAKNIDLYGKIIEKLESIGLLNRELENLPTAEVLSERKRLSQGLTMPEVSVLVAYQKIAVKNAILQSDLPEDINLINYLFSIFPEILREQYSQYMPAHMLRREIIATQISSHLIDAMGIAFIYRLQEETGANIPEIVKAFHIAERVFSVDKLRQEIQHLKYKVDLKTQLKMLKKINRLLRRATRWFLRNRQKGLDIQVVIKEFEPYISELSKHLVRFLTKTDKLRLSESVERFVQAGVSQHMAKCVADSDMLSSALDIVQAVLETQLPIKTVATAYFSVGALLDLNWLREQVVLHQIKSRWDALARTHFRDDLDRWQRTLTVKVLKSISTDKPVRRQVERWLKQFEKPLLHWEQVIADLRTASVIDSVMFSVVLRELRYVAMGME